MAQQLVNAIILGSIYTLFALGLTLSWGILNVLNLAHGAILMTGALIAWEVTSHQELSIAIVLPLAMVGTGLLTVALEWLVLRPVRRRYKDERSAELGMLIASVGASAIPITAAVVLTDDVIQSIPDGVMSVVTWDILGIRITNIGVLIIVLALILSLGLLLFVQRTKYGHALRAVAYDPDATQLMGVSTDRLASLTMFVSGALAGAAGVLLAIQLGSLQARMGEPLMLKAFAVIILGGVGSLGGGIVAAYLLAIVETAVLVYIEPGLKDVVAFALIITLLLLRPQGLFSRAAWQRA